MTNQELVKRIFNGEGVDPRDALSVYANPENWGGYYPDPRKHNVGKVWVWKGPVICAYDLASTVLQNRYPPQASLHSGATKKRLDDWFCDGGGD